MEYKDFADPKEFSQFCLNLGRSRVVSIETVRGSRFDEDQERWLKDTELYRVWYWA